MPTSDFQLRVANRILSNIKNHLVLVLLFSMFSVAVSAQNFTVTSNADTHATAPAASSGGLDAGGQTTLRSAMEAATAIAGSHIITIPGSITTINLSLGQITAGSASLGNNITVNGGGKAVLTINQTTLNRIFITGTGAITFIINDLTMNYTGPAGSFVTGGGGCVQAGGTNALTNMTNVAINNFNVEAGNGGAFVSSAANVNGITLTNCDFNNNFAGGGGGAVSIQTTSTATLTNCKFTNNSTGNLGSNTGGSGGALSVSGTGGTFNVTNCTFLNNHQTTASQGGAVMVSGGTLNISFCRFIGNTAAIPTNGNTLAVAGGGGQVINAENNWWGTNSGPAANDAVVLAAGATINLTKWLQLKTSINTNPLCTGGSATVTASFLSNSNAEAVTNVNVSTLIGQPISFVNPTLGSLSSAQATIQNNGAATVTFTAGGTAGTGSVNAVVDNIPNNDVAPAKVSVTINPGAAVTGNPSNSTVCAGSNASFTASFSGTPTPTIQWQVSTNGGGVYNNIAGATSSPLTFATVAGNTGNLYRAVGTNTCGSTNTTGALLTVNTAPAVTGNPSNQSVPSGNNASFTASFSGSPTPALQWQVSTNGGGTYNNIAGATSSPLVFTTSLGQSGNLYRAVGTNLCSSATTTGALLTVTNACATSSVIAVSGTSTICSGQQANIKVTITGGASPFTVVYNDGAGNISVPGYISGSNIPVSPTTTTTYTLTSVTDANSCVGSGNSGSATITVNTAAAVTGNPSNTTVCAGANASFTASFSGTPTPTIQWQLSSDGGANYNNIAGATSSPLTFVTVAGNNGNLYRAVGTNSCGSVNTTGALLTVNTAPAVTGNPSNQSVPAGSNASFTASFSGSPAPTLQWQVSTNGGGTYNNIAGATSSPLVFLTNLSQSGNLYRCVGTNLCSSATTTGALLTVTNACATSSVISVSGASSICNGQQANIKVTITGGASPFTVVYNDGTNNFSVPGYTSGSNIPVSPTSTTTYTLVSVTDANSCVGSGNSGSATITVNPAITAGITNNSGSTVLTCSLTAISVTATGGTTYLWDGGATPNTAANSFSAPGTYHVTVTGAGGCNAPAQITITQNITPPTAGITNNSGSTVLTCLLTAISVTATGGVSYSWDGGSTPNTAANSFSSPGTYTVTVTGANGCTSQAQITITQNITPPTAGITNNTGTTQLDCTITSISVTATGGVSYSWDGGATPNTAANSFSSPGTYTVTVTGANGCTSQAQITITQSVTPPTAGITNNSGSTVLTCSLTSISVTATGGVSYSWDGGATPNTAANSFSSPGTYTVTVTAAGGCTAQAQIMITQNNTPPTAGITNNSGTTQLGCGVTSISVTATGGVSYSWSGGTTPNTAANSLTSTGTYTVTVTGANGCTSQAQITITTNPGIPAAPGPFTGPVNVCRYVGTGEQLTYTTPPVAGATYVWTVPPTINIISGQGTNSLTITLNPNFIANGNKQLRVVATTGCGTSPLGICYLLAQAPNTPQPILATGTNACPIIGTTNTYTYTIRSVIGATSYQWEAQAGTTVINHPNGTGINDTTVTVNFLNGFTNSNITVRSGTDSCGLSGPRSIAITANFPSAPSPITGPVNACEFIAPNGGVATYSVNNDAANTYNWTIPAGAIGVTGQGTSSISFTFPAGYTSGSISVTATNGCGTGLPRTLNITRFPPSALSGIDVIQTATCPNREFTYSVSAIPANATSVQWTVPTAAGAVILSGQGTTSISVSYPVNAVNASVTAVAVNNCGSSAVRSTPVRLPACPPPGRGFAKGNTASNTIAATTTETMLVNLFPNPTVSDFKMQVITADKEKINVRITDMQGRELKQLVVMPTQAITVGSDLKAGSYMVEVRQGAVVRTTKLIKF